MVNCTLLGVTCLLEFLDEDVVPVDNYLVNSAELADMLLSCEFLLFANLFRGF